MKSNTFGMIRVVILAAALICATALAALGEELYFRQGMNLKLLEQDGVTISLNGKQPEYAGDDYIRLGARVKNDKDVPVTVQYSLWVNGTLIPLDTFYVEFDEAPAKGEADGLIWIVRDQLAEAGAEGVSSLEDIKTLGLSFTITGPDGESIGEDATVNISFEAPPEDAEDNGLVSTGNDKYYTVGQDLPLWEMNGLKIYLMGDAPECNDDGAFVMKMGIENANGRESGPVAVSYISNASKGTGWDTFYPYEAFSKDDVFWMKPERMDQIKLMNLQFRLYDKDQETSVQKEDGKWELSDQFLYESEPMTIHFDWGERAETFVEEQARVMAERHKTFVPGEDLTLCDQNGLTVILNGSQPKLSKGTLALTLKNNTGSSINMHYTDYDILGDYSHYGGDFVYKTWKNGSTNKVEITVKPEDMETFVQEKTIRLKFRGQTYQANRELSDLYHVRSITVDFPEGIVDAAGKPADSKETPEEGAGKVHTDKATVKAVQEALNAAGYNCGTPDGQAGKNTKKAISAYQTDNGLEVTGTVTDELLEALGVA